MLAKADEMYEQFFGKDDSFSDIKKKYNNYMLSKEGGAPRAHIAKN